MYPAYNRGLLYGGLAIHSLEVYNARLLEAIKSTLTRQQVRILLGVFTCTPEQVADIARSCGASGTRPFCQMFHRKGEMVERVVMPEQAERVEVDPQKSVNCVAFPSYAIVLGPSSKLTYAETNDAPDLPTWLEENAKFRSLCATLPNIPSWDDTKGVRSGGHQMLDLGNVKQKPTDMEWWVERVHQLMLFVGTARSGMGAKRRRYKPRGPGWVRVADI